MKRAGKWAGNIILGLVLCAVLFAFLIPTVFSGSLAIVRSSSMEPAMRAGALAVMLPVDVGNVKVGDIIVFNPPWDSDPDVTVSHRVIGVYYYEDIFLGDEAIYFDTKGDATEDPDPQYVPAQSLHGRVLFSIPYLGYAANAIVGYVRTWLGFVTLVCIPMVILVWSAIRDVSRSQNVRSKRLNKRLERQRRWRRRRRFST
jgi:signal peptidase